MARYIDADKFIAELEQEKTAALEFGDGVAAYEIEHTMNLISMQPTADVVPKSEADNLIKVIDNTTQQFLELHDLYQNAKSEVEKLSHKCDDCAGCTQWKCDCANIELEVARKIFEEIDAIKVLGTFPWGWWRQYTELKKKYADWNMR